jgi:gliding motility-associated-like protein
MLDNNLSSVRKWVACSALFCLSFVSGALYAQLTPVLQITDARCFGLRGKIVVQQVHGGAQPYYYSLDSISYSTNPTLAGLVPGKHTLYLRDDAGNHGIYPFTIGQPDELKAELTSSKLVVEPNEEIELSVQISPIDARIDHIYWRPQNKFAENMDRTNTVSILQNTIFAVEVADSALCVSYDQVEVKVHNSDIYLPNAIASRSTANEVFTVYGASKVVNIKQMTIVDRYGRVLFFKKDMIPNDTSAGWNGRSDGKPVNPGVYFYKCQLLFDDGRTEEFTGDVTVVN